MSRRRIALTRAVPESLEDGERTYVERQPIDLDLARRQHAAYRRCLAELRCSVEVLPAEPTLPDSVFIEDAAVVLDELGIVARPGARSRRAEVASVAGRLQAWRQLRPITAPGTLDGGDVLRVGRTLYVGRSARTNAAGIEQLHVAVEELEYDVVPVPVDACLHLLSACSWIGDSTVLINPDWIDAAALCGLSAIEVDPGEPAAANVLFFPDRGTVLMPAEYPETARRLRTAGREVVCVAISEFLKAEAGVSCLSLLL